MEGDIGSKVDVPVVGSSLWVFLFLLHGETKVIEGNPVPGHEAVRNLGKEFCDILFLEGVGEFTEAVVADKKHVFPVYVCPEGGGVCKVHLKGGGDPREIELLKTRGVREVDDGVGVYLYPVFPCKMMEGKAESSVATTHFNNINLWEGQLP